MPEFRDCILHRQWEKGRMATREAATRIELTAGGLLPEWEDTELRNEVAVGTKRV
jgi:hypothetical protein